MKEQKISESPMGKALSIILFLIFLFILATLTGLAVKFVWINIILAKACVC